MGIQNSIGFIEGSGRNRLDINKNIGPVGLLLRNNVKIHAAAKIQHINNCLLNLSIIHLQPCQPLCAVELACHTGMSVLYVSLLLCIVTVIVYSVEKNHSACVS